MELWAVTYNVDDPKLCKRFHDQTADPGEWLYFGLVNYIFVIYPEKILPETWPHLQCFCFVPDLRATFSFGASAKRDFSVVKAFDPTSFHCQHWNCWDEMHQKCPKIAGIGDLGVNDHIFPVFFVRCLDQSDQRTKILVLTKTPSWFKMGFCKMDSYQKKAPSLKLRIFWS